MVPAAFVFLEQMPLTPNGKLNRKAFPAPEVGTSEEVIERPRTPVEEIVAGIWAEVLKLEKVGIHDNFFELGGHSLLATQVISRLSKAMGVELPLRLLFQFATVAGIAREVEQGWRQGAVEMTPPILTVNRERALPLSFAQQRLWFLEQLEPGTAVYNVPAGVRLGGEVNREGLQWALSEIMRRHEVLRTSFPAEEGRARQCIAEPSEMPLPVIDVSENGEALARQLAEEEAVRPFDLEHGPVWRSTLLRLGAEDHVLMVTMHHIASDGWSAGILVSEFVELYTAWQEQRAATLPDLGVQYADFAVWQRDCLQGEVLERQTEYWKEQLQDLVPLELPSDRARPAVASHRGATHHFVIGVELAAGLRELSRREGVTLFMTLLAAFDVLLARYSGLWDIAVGTDIANRNRLETERLIGFFINQAGVASADEGRGELPAAAGESAGSDASSL